MKRLIYTTLLISISLSALGKQDILYYEYNGDDCCYYALELDITHENGTGTFYAVNCYDELDYLEVSVASWFSVYYDGRDRYRKYVSGKTERLIFIPIGYIYPQKRPYITRGEYEIEMASSNRDFIFWYDIKDDLKRLEYGYYVFDREDPNERYFSSLGKETMYLSEFMKEHQIEWFPPYLEQVKALDYKKFPKSARKKVRKEHAKNRRK